MNSFELWSEEESFVVQSSKGEDDADAWVEDIRNCQSELVRYISRRIDRVILRVYFRHSQRSKSNLLRQKAFYSHICNRSAGNLKEKHNEEKIAQRKLSVFSFQYSQGMGMDFSSQITIRQPLPD